MSFVVSEDSTMILPIIFRVVLLFKLLLLIILQLQRSMGLPEGFPMPAQGRKTKVRSAAPQADAFDMQMPYAMSPSDMQYQMQQMFANPLNYMPWMTPEITMNMFNEYLSVCISICLVSHLSILKI